MTHIHRFPASSKAASTNPLKMSAPLGGALAFLGMDRCLPLFHGSQGCTAFGMVLLVRHFREAIPLQTTAMNQVSTILGGYENLEEALKTIYERNKPSLIGVCTTGVTETKGEDLDGHLKTFRMRNPDLNDLNLVFVSTPDFNGGFEDGYAAVVQGIVESFAEPADQRVKGQVNILAGCHLTPGDVEEIRDIVESFGLSPIIVPDLSLSMSGRQPSDFTATSLGGTTIDQVRSMGASEVTLVVGEQMRRAAASLELKTDVPSLFFDRLTGLEASDRFIKALAEISGRPVPARLRRQRESLVDGMLDGHFFLTRKKMVVALEPDHLFTVTSYLQDLGVDVVAAVAPQQAAVLEKVKAGTVMVGDHSDVEAMAKGCDLIISNSHGRMGAAHAGVPLYRMGLPMFDRLGSGLVVTVGYRGSRELLFALANIFLAAETDHESHHGNQSHEHGHDGCCGGSGHGGGREGGSCGCTGA